MWDWLTSGRFGYLADYLLWTFVAVSLPVHTYCFLKLFPRARYRRSALVIGNLLIFLSLLGVLAWSAETWYRFASIGTDSFGVTLPAQRWFMRYVSLNSWGCRDREWLPRPPANVYRVAFVGDSFVYGWGLPRVEDRLSERVATALSAKMRRPVEPMNFARPGWDTGDQIEPLRALLESYRVDEVVLVHVPNDIERLLPVRRDFDPRKPPRCAWLNTDGSALAEHLYYHVYLPWAPTVRGYHAWLAEGYADPAIWSQQQARFAALADLCRAKGIPFRVVLFPFLRTDAATFDAGRIARQHVEYFESVGVPVLDLHAPLSGMDAAQWVVSRQDAHPNARAHDLAAQAILGAFYSR